MKLTGASFSSRCASRVSSLPLLSSSPTDSRPTRGAAQVERDARVGRSHHGELDQVRRPAADGGAGVEQDRGRAPRRDDGGERRTIDARQQAERGVRGHHRRAGVAGAEERVGAAVADRFGRDPDRGARLAPQRLRRALGHLDPLGRVDDLDVDPAEQAGHRVARQLALDRGGVADQQQPDLQVPRRDQRAIDDDGRPGVAAHGVDASHMRVSPAARLELVAGWLEAILRPP